MPAVARAAASAGGRLLEAATSTLAAVRAAARPLHPLGDVVRGRLVRHGSDETTGVPWLDEPGEDEVVARVSRAIGLPAVLPDIHGLAVRVPTAEGYGDLLFASTGRGRLSRFVLTASWRPGGRPLTTLLPYRTSTGPVLLGARALDGSTYELSWARPSGDWRLLGELHLADDPGDEDVSFDPVRNRVPGLEQYPTVVRLREPAYLRARKSRS